jgi:hypothetical protein
VTFFCSVIAASTLEKTGTVLLADVGIDSGAGRSNSARYANLCL